MMVVRSGELQSPADLFEELNAQQVRYCHWKGNSHLGAGFDGSSDLDLLFDVREAQRVGEILARHGFKLFPTHPSRAFPGVEDYLGTHAESGRLLHLHTHYRLNIGKRHINNFRMMWEEELLNTRVLDEEYGIFVAEPSHELVLLVLRAALEIRGRDRLKQLVGLAGSTDRRAELDWLGERGGIAGPVRLATERYGPETGRLVEAAMASHLALDDLVRLRRALFFRLREARARGRLAAFAFGLGREVRWAVGSVNRKWIHRIFPYARSAPGGGVVVAVVGGDGAGKSTTMSGLHAWMDGKVDVLPIYFGSGKGPVSLLRLPLVAVRSVSDKLAKSGGAGRGRPGVVKAVWALLVAREKRIRARRAFRARERGYIVLCDRFPQTEIQGMIDSPLLSDWASSRSSLLRRVAAWERAPYQSIEEVGPDLVLRLTVAPEKAHARRPSEDPSHLDARSAVADALEFKNARFGVHEIDGAQPREAVLLEAKRWIWSIL